MAIDILTGYLEGKGPEALTGIKPEFAQNLARFLEDNPFGLSIISGYRSPERQSQLFDAAVAKYGSEDAARKWVAPPGRSNHNRSSAFDLSYEDGDARKWAHENAPKYGLAFPMKHEPWHVEPIGARGGGSAPHNHDEPAAPTQVAAAPQGQAPMANPADVPAAGAAPTSAFALPGGTALDGKAGGPDWDTLMMGMALLANAIPNGTASKDIGSIMSPFLTAQSKKDDRNYQRGRDAKQDARFDRTETRQSAMDAQNQANWQAQFGLSKSTNERQAQAEERANAKPLIQKFEDAAGNPTYKQFDITTKQWVPLSDGSAPAGAPAMPPASAAPVTAGSPAMDGLPSPMAAPPGAAAPAAMPGIVPPPPGVNREQWYKDQTSRLAKEAGGPTSEEATGLRKEIQQLPSYKNMSQAAPIYSTMADAAGRNTKAADLNLVYGLGKIFDPNSVVREGEMVMVKSTASLPDWFAGIVGQVNGGAALTPETRERIMQEAYSRMQGYQGQYNQDVQQYAGIADRRKMNRDDVIFNFGKFDPWKAPQASATPGATSGGSTGDGRQTKVINGKTYVKEKNSSSWFEE